MTPEECGAFAQRVRERFGTSEPFVPSAYYDADGDCVEFLISNEPFYGQRLDRWVTVYEHMDTGEVVGSLIKDVGKLWAAYPGLNIEVTDGRVRISHMLRAAGWLQGDEVKQRVYKKLIEEAEEHRIDAEALPAVA